MRNFLTGMMSTVAFTAVVGALALGAGCGKKSAATCENAAEHAMKLVMNSDDMKKAPDDQKKMAETMMAGLKDEIIKDCKEKKWDEKQLACVMSATKMDDMEKCETKK